MPALGTVASVQTGRVAPLGDSGEYSAIVKTPVGGRVQANPLGLEGDEQADLAHHGGPDKAVYGYAAGHYAAWRADFPRHAGRLAPGAFGENLTIEGADETSICLGDVLAIGGAVLVACQPRQPCSTLARYFEDRTIGRAMTRHLRNGWYCRVRQPGALGAGDAVTLLERPNPAWPFARFLAGLRDKAFTEDELAELADLPGLADEWRRKAARALERRSAA